MGRAAAFTTHADDGGGVFFFSRRAGLSAPPSARGGTPVSYASSNATSKSSVPPPPPPARENPVAFPDAVPDTLDRTTSLGSESLGAASLPFWSKREQVSYDEDAIVESGRKRCDHVAQSRLDAPNEKWRELLPGTTSSRLSRVERSLEKLKSKRASNVSGKYNADYEAVVASALTAPMPEAQGAILPAASSISVASSSIDAFSARGSNSFESITEASDSLDELESVRSQPVDDVNAGLMGGLFGSLWCAANGDAGVGEAEQRDQEEEQPERELDGARDGGLKASGMKVRSKIIYRSKVVPGVETVPYKSGTVIVDAVSLKIDDIANKLETKREKRREKQRSKRKMRAKNAKLPKSRSSTKKDEELLSKLEVRYDVQ
ncbi:hypothetical protein ACHAXT_011671 [Thalassiosira profunda]